VETSHKVEEGTISSSEVSSPVEETPGDKYLRRIAKKASITVGGNVITQLFGPITGVITTRALGMEMYGIYSICVSWTGMLADLSRVGFGGDTLIRFIGQYTGERRLDKAKGAIEYITKVVTVLSLLLTVALAIFAEPFARLVLKMPEAATPLRFFAPAIFLTSLYGALIAMLAGFQAQRYIVLASSIWANVANLISLVIFVFLGMKLYAGLGSSLIQDVTILVLSIYFLFKVFPGLRDRQLKPVVEKKQLRTYAGTIFATSLFSKYAYRLDLLFLGRYALAAEVGVYAVALKLQPIIYMPHYAISQIFAPLVAQLYAQGEHEELESIYKTVTKWTMSFSLPIFATFALFGESILAIFGKDLHGAMLPLTILGVGSSVVDGLGMSGQVIAMIGKPHVNLINSIIITVVSIGLYLLLIPTYGAVGAAVASAAALIIINLIRVAEVYSFLRIHPLKWSIWKVGAALGIALIPVLAVQRLAIVRAFSWAWIPETLLLWGVYFGATWMLGLDSADRVVVDAILRKVRRRSKKEAKR
jgi:O-antigen/teichoic acid export membrane protein